MVMMMMREEERERESVGSEVLVLYVVEVL